MAKAKTVKAVSRKVSKAEPAATRPVKETYTKSALINLIAEENDIPRKTAVGVYATLEKVFLGSVHPRGIGEFTLPGLLKVTLRKVPARKAGTLVRNPADGRNGQSGSEARKRARQNPAAVQTEVGGDKVKHHQSAATLLLAQ